MILRFRDNSRTVSVPISILYVDMYNYIYICVIYNFTYLDTASHTRHRFYDRFLAISLINPIIRVLLLCDEVREMKQVRDSFVSRLRKRYLPITR